MDDDVDDDDDHDRDDQDDDDNKENVGPQFKFDKFLWIVFFWNTPRIRSSSFLEPSSFPKICFPTSLR